jgi:carbamoyl-phosphate synthase large subunit
VTKAPRFAFEKFPEADDTLTTQMKSVGETMAIGSTFKESFQKALRGLEVGSFGFGCDNKRPVGDRRTARRGGDSGEARASLRSQRVWHIRYAFKMRDDRRSRFHELSGIDPWFLDNLLEIVETEEVAPRASGEWEARRPSMRCGRPSGSASPIGSCRHFQARPRWRSGNGGKSAGFAPRYKSVDTCAAEFEAYTPYYYSTYETEDEVPEKAPGKKRIMILGGGPNRIGQGIEFDYCCCHASFALRELGIESIMVNSNPETVSTDYDTSDLLFFEPLTVEDVLNICDRVQPDGVIVQFGGQTPLNLARALKDAGVPIIGTSVDTIEAAEDREKFPADRTTRPAATGQRHRPQHGRGAGDCAKIGFPVLVRPSFVLGGRAMEICYDQSSSRSTCRREAFVVAQGQPVLIDSFLEDAIEVDVDAISDGET